jgi:hypothetical protein
LEQLDMAKGKRRACQRIPKEERQSLRLWAEGMREAVLTAHIEHYAAELQRGWRYERDYLQKVTREFHVRFDWRLKDHKEPESLPDFDPKAMIPTEQLGEEDEVAKSARIKVLDKVRDIYT